jgi:hypothetical protein
LHEWAYFNLEPSGSSVHPDDSSQSSYVSSPSSTPVMHHSSCVPFSKQESLDFIEVYFPVNNITHFVKNGVRLPNSLEELQYYSGLNQNMKDTICGEEKRENNLMHLGQKFKSSFKSFVASFGGPSNLNESSLPIMKNTASLLFPPITSLENTGCDFHSDSVSKLQQKPVMIHLIPDVLLAMAPALYLFSLLLPYINPENYNFYQALCLFLYPVSLYVCKMLRLLASERPRRVILPYYTHLTTKIVSIQGGKDSQLSNLPSKGISVSVAPLKENLSTLVSPNNPQSPLYFFPTTSDSDVLGFQICQATSSCIESRKGEDGREEPSTPKMCFYGSQSNPVSKPTVISLGNKSPVKNITLPKMGCVVELPSGDVMQSPNKGMSNKTLWVNNSPISNKMKFNFRRMGMVAKQKLMLYQLHLHSNPPYLITPFSLHSLLFIHRQQFSYSNSSGGSVKVPKSNILLKNGFASFDPLPVNQSVNSLEEENVPRVNPVFIRSNQEMSLVCFRIYLYFFLFFFSLH